MASSLDEQQITLSPLELRTARDELQRFLLEYRFGMQEIETKIAILRDEFLNNHDYNPIEHVSSRVKSPDSLVDKVCARASTPTSSRSARTSPTSRACASRAASSPTPIACSIC